MILLKYGASTLVNLEDNSAIKPVELAWRGLPGTSGLALMILIAAGTNLDLDFLLSQHEFVDEQKLLLFDAVVEGLVYRRKQLQAIAALHLPHYQRSWAADTVKVLDEQASMVSTELGKYGVRVPRALSTPSLQTTVFHTRFIGILDLQSQRLFDAGFMDFDGRNYEGFTPLMGQTWPLYSSVKTLHYAQWLCDRGADVLCPFPKCMGRHCKETHEHQRPIALRAIHSVASRIGDALLIHRWSLFDSAISAKCDSTMVCSELISTIVTSDISDGCSCACSSQGCIPVLNLLGGVGGISGHRGNWILRWLDLYFPYVFPRLFLKLLRLWTFDAVGLTHTCCRHGCRRYKMLPFSPWKKSCPFSIPPDEEIQEIHDEEQYLVCLLDSLMTEFTEQWMWPEKPSEWGVDSFMSNVWRPRLKQIKKESTQISEEQQARLRSLGIKMQLDDKDRINDTENDGEVSSEGDSSKDDSSEQESAESAVDGVQEIRTFFTDSEVAGILKESARVNGLNNYDVWFKMIAKLGL